jgi:hypothetical protein
LEGVDVAAELAFEGGVDEPVLLDAAQAGEACATTRALKCTLSWDCTSAVAPGMVASMRALTSSAVGILKFQG